jgi:hypothetical protein
MIEKLKKENAQLREELALATGGVCACADHLPYRLL